jgi:hypothetical protein
LAETTTKTEINQAFNKLKTQLTSNKHRIIAQDPPNSLVAVQGSIWGTTPKTAKKKTTCTLTQKAKETHVTCTTHLTSDYVNFTLAGVVFSVALLIVCVWIALDLQSFAVNGGFWSWLTLTDGQFDASKASILISLTGILAAFLTVSIAIEAIIVSKVCYGIRSYAKETIETLKE